jgi:uncharacterized protein YfaP (DUF2135 family)
MTRINFKLRLSGYPIPPPPPPKPRKSRTLIAAIVIVLIAVLVVPSVLFYSGLLSPTNPGASPTPFPSITATPFSTPNPSSPTVTPTPASQTIVNIATSEKTPVTAKSIGSSGGTIQVTDTASPLKGLNIDVPQAATEQPIQFAISYSTVSSIAGLPSSCSVASKMISIETTGSETFNKYKMFDKPVTVTLPYNAEETNDDGNPVRFYWYDSQTCKLDSAGFFSEDKTVHTITFLTGSFSDFVAVRTMLNITGSLWGVDAPIDTGFRPARDGWFIPNYGSYLDYSKINDPNGTTGGFCLGMVSYAKWYYSEIATGLHSLYLEGNRTEWRDDATAIQLAARAHIGTTGIWKSLTQEERNWATANAREVALSWISGMIVTGEPQLIGLKALTSAGKWLDYAHAVMTYSYNNGKFEIYDPNFPGTSPGDSMREINFTYTKGFTDIYVSGVTSASKLRFNVFYHAGSKLAATPNDYRGLYDAAKTGFKDNSLFPTVKLTDLSTSPTGTTPTDTNHDGIRDTTEAKTTISGTINGGKDQINSTLIYVDNVKYTAAVVNGEFSKEVPLMAGDNDVAILATADDTFSEWAGFLSDKIRSTASPSSLTVTLTWDQDSSDVDLHVQEPGTSGRHIYWDNTGYAGTNPYLDMDNTHGYGPEHYYATPGATLPDSTSLYGTYQIRVEYYADHSGAETTQPITWHLNVKYLAFKDATTGQEFWVEQSRSGALASAQSSGTSDFESSGPGWTNIWNIEYPAPNPTDYGIKQPPQNVFPTPPP